MTYTISLDDLPIRGSARSFVGKEHGDAHVSLVVMPGVPVGWRPMPLHSHPYQEICLVIEGRSTFTVIEESGERTWDAMTGDIIVIPARTPHKWFNSGDVPLRQIDIHDNPEFVMGSAADTAT